MQEDIHLVWTSITKWLEKYGSWFSNLISPLLEMYKIIPQKQIYLGSNFFFVTNYNTELIISFSLTLFPVSFVDKIIFTE
jgi:hypothetical protein